MEVTQTDIAESVANSTPRPTRRRSGVATACLNTQSSTSVQDDASVDALTAESGNEDLVEDGPVVLLDTSQSLESCRKELGCKVGQLLTPLTRRTRVSDLFGIDNGCFSSFPEKRFWALLEREKRHQDLCKFVAVPDVVGEARRTLELFDHFKYQLSGWPLALVMQNGMENFGIPWRQIAAVFIGGTDKKDGNGDWKLSAHAEAIIRTAKVLGKWVHVGRVNTPARLDKFTALGVDSVDGTGISRYSWMREMIDHPRLELE